MTNDLKPTSTPTTSRRHFLKTSSAATAGFLSAPAILGTKSSAASPGDTIKVGLIGAGGRGSGAAGDALTADPNTVLTAIADIYPEQAQRTVANLKASNTLGERVDVPSKNIFAGFDAYKAVLESGVDVVILATPPGFRPQHVKAAVEAGKHMFVEKPMATDAPGLRSIMASVAEARKRKLGVCAGYCWRYNASERALYERIHAGDIGEIRSAYCTYNTGLLWDRTNPRDTTDLQKQLRNWYYYTWLSGDHYLEQAVHAVDWLCWAMKDIVPVKAIAHGGRQVRTAEKYGNIFDHFEVVYEYANGARGFVFARQQAGCANDNLATFYGTKGTAYEMSFGPAPNHIKDLSGEMVWRFRGDRPNMYVQEHKEFFASLRSGQPINNGDRMASSTMVGLLGRMAAYTGQSISYEEALNSQEKLVPDSLTWDSPAPVSTIAMPGQTKFV
jgi:predicted dehydrogenase